MCWKRHRGFESLPLRHSTRSACSWQAIRGRNHNSIMKLPDGLQRVECPEPARAEHVEGVEGLSTRSACSWQAIRGRNHNSIMKLPDGLQRVECPEPARAEHVEGVEGLAWVYILFCRNGTYYTGQSVDVQLRLKRHSEGAGARHTLQLKDFRLVYVEGPMTKELAIKRERQIKKWSHAKKSALIMGDTEKLRGLSKSSPPQATEVHSIQSELRFLP